MDADPPSEAALRRHLDADERLDRSFAVRDGDGRTDPALSSRPSAYRYGRTPSAHVFLGPTGEFRRLPDRKVRSAGLARPRLTRWRAVAGVVLGLCLVLWGVYIRYTTPGWSYPFQVVGWGAVVAVGVLLAHRRWLSRRVYRIETDAKERIEFVVPPAAERHLAAETVESDENGANSRQGDGTARDRDSGTAGRDIGELLLGRDPSTVVVTTGGAVVAILLWWGMLLWRHPFAVGLGDVTVSGTALVLAGAGPVAVAFRATRGLVPTLFSPLAVGFGLRHYSCLTVSQFHPVSVLCVGTGLVEALAVALPLWGAGLGLALAVEGVGLGTKRARDHVRRIYSE